MLCFAMLALLLVNSPGDFVHRVKIVGGTYSFFYDGETDCGERVIRNGAGSIVQCGLDRAADMREFRLPLRETLPIWRNGLNYCAPTKSFAKQSETG